MIVVMMVEEAKINFQICEEALFLYSTIAIRLLFYNYLRNEFYLK